MIMCILLSMVYGLFKLYWLTYVTCTCFKETALLFNVHRSCFVDFILCPTNKYMFKVNDKKIRLICWMCSKLKINTQFWCFYCWRWSQSAYNFSVSTFNFEQVFHNRVWKTSDNVLKTQKAIYLLHCKSCEAYFIQWFFIASNRTKVWTNDHTMNILWTYVSALNLLQESHVHYHRFVPLFDLLYHRCFPEI